MLARIVRSNELVRKKTFGSINGYLDLFLWAAGADQAKNFVQIVTGKNSGGGQN